MLACFIGILWLAFCLIASPVRAQFIERTTSYQTENPVIVDGKLDEAVWNSAVLLGPFRSNDRALPTRTSTFARLLWDRDFLYVALQCEDFDLQSEKMGRDHRIWETDDNIKLVIDPDGDGKDFLSWTINPLNALLDYHRPDEWATENVHWNAAGVQTAVEIDGTISNARDEDRGWRAEIAIPWSVFAVNDAIYRVLDYYKKGMEAYEAFDFPTARDLFRQALEVDPTDGPSLLYVDRCADFILNPPSDLIFRAQSK